MIFCFALFFYKFDDFYTLSQSVNFHRCLSKFLNTLGNVIHTNLQILFCKHHEVS